MTTPRWDTMAVDRARRLVVGLALCLLAGTVVAVPPPAHAQDPTPSAPQSTIATSPDGESPVPASTTSPPDDVTEPTPLGPFELFAHLHAESLASGQVGYVVTDAQGDVVAEEGSRLSLIPASTMKVLTAAAVLDTLSPYRRVTTRVRSPGPPDADGVVSSLVVVGAGDPALTSDAYRTHIYPSRPATSIEDLADRVVAAGVTRVAGDIVGDGTMFGPLDVAPGWPAHYLADFDARHIAGLTINAGVEVETGPRNGYDVLLGQRLAVHPQLLTAWELARALQERGVVVEGSATMATVPPDTGHQVAWVGSPPMGKLLQFMLEESDNHLADTLVRTSGLRAEGVGTWSAGGRAVAAAMEGLGADVTGLIVDDGSGLSRFDRVTPLALAQVDHGLYEQFGATWSDWLSTAGVDGTFEERLLGTAAAGHFHGKSGTLDDVKARVGHVVADDGSRMHMAAIGNGLTDGDRWRAIVMADDLVLVMLDHLEGCTRVPADNEPDGVGDASGSPSPATTAPAVVELPAAPLADSSVWTRTCGPR